MVNVVFRPVLVCFIQYGLCEPLNPLLVPEEDATRICDKVTTKRVDLGLELLADLLEGFWVEGAAEGVVEERDEGRCVIR